MWLVAAYSGPGGIWERPCYNQRQAATHSGPGTTQQKAQSTLRAATTCLGPVDLGEFSRKLVAWLKLQVSNSLWKSLGQCVSWVEHGLRESPAWGKQCLPSSQRFRFFTCLPCSLCGGRTQHRVNGGPFPEATQLNFSMSLACFPFVEDGCECLWMSVCVQALRAAGFPVARCLSRTQTLLIFIAKLTWGSLFLELEPWAGTPPSLMGTSEAEISLKILNHHTWVWGQPVSHLCLSYWPLLYILYCKSFIQPVFRWFCRLIAVHLYSISYRSLLELLSYHVTTS